MKNFIELPPCILKILLNIQEEIKLQDELLVTDEDEDTSDPTAELYRLSREKELALYTYLGEAVFELYLEEIYKMYKLHGKELELEKLCNKEP